MPTDNLSQISELSVQDALKKVFEKNPELNRMEQEVELASELKEIAEARPEVGESTELDLMQAEIQLTNADNELNRAEDQKNWSRYALFTAIGLDPDQQQYGINYPDS